MNFFVSSHYLLHLFHTLIRTGGQTPSLFLSATAYKVMTISVGIRTNVNLLKLQWGYESQIHINKYNDINEFYLPKMKKFSCHHIQ